MGDGLVVHSRRVDAGTLDGLTLEVPHGDGSPPFVIRWLDDDHVSVSSASSDATVRAQRPHSDARAET